MRVELDNEIKNERLMNFDVDKSHSLTNISYHMQHLEYSI